MNAETFVALAAYTTDLRIGAAGVNQQESSPPHKRSVGFTTAWKKLRRTALERV